MPYEKVFKRGRKKTGPIRQFRDDKQIGEAAPDIQKHFGYRYDKTVRAVCEENHVTSITKLREKLREKRARS